MTNQLTKSLGAATLLVIGGWLMITPVIAQSNPHNNITICHANNGNGTGGYVNITVNADSIFKQGHDQHQDHRDIIPPFDYDNGESTSHYDGLNWDEAGQALWNNGCNDVASTPNPSPSATPTPSSTPQPAPAVGGNSQPERFSALGNDNLVCTSTTFDATMDVKDHGNAVKDVLVTFIYNGNTQQARTNENGRAKVTYTQNGDGVLTASAEGYPTQSMFITVPRCAPVHLDPDRTHTASNNSTNTSATSGRGAGQVLGSSTLASTGHDTPGMAVVTFTSGLLMTIGSVYGYFQTKQN